MADHQEVSGPLPTEKDVQDWLYQLTDLELNETMTTLGLRNDSNRLLAICRAYNWLQGNYTAEDFVECEATSVSEARTLRETLRRTYLEEMCFERSSTTLQDEDYHKGMPHPLSIYDKEVTCASESDRHAEEKNSEIPENTEVFGKETTSAGSEDQREDNEHSSDWSELLKAVMDTAKVSDAKYATLAEEVTALRARDEEKSKEMSRLAKAVQDMTALQEQLLQQLRTLSGPLSSTRIDSVPERLRGTGEGFNPVSTQTPQVSGRQRVNFQDTFQVDYPHNSSLRDESIHLQDDHHSNERRLWRVEAVGARPPSSTTLGSTLNRSGGGPRDLSRIANGWNIKFSAAKGEDVESFIRRVEESGKSAQLSEGEMLSALPWLFKDVVSIWYSHHKDTWDSWEGFCKALRRRWGCVRDKQERLRDQLRGRKQQQDESVSRYVTCMEFILREMSPRLSQKEEVEKIYENLLPQIKRIVRREGCDTIDTLVERGHEAEYTLEREKEDRTPLSPSKAVLPDAAYKGPGKKTEKSAPSVKVAATEVPPPKDLNATSAAVASGYEALVGLIAKQFESVSKKQTEAIVKAFRETSKSNQNGGGRSSSPNWKKGKGGQNKGQNDQNKGHNSQNKGQSNNQKRGQSQEKRGPLKCFGCGKEGVKRADCPTCQGNANKGG